MVKQQQSIHNRYQSDSSSDSSSDDQSRNNHQESFQQSQQQRSQQQGPKLQQRLVKLQKQQQQIKKQLKQLPYGMILKQRQQLQKQRSQLKGNKLLKHKRNNKQSTKNQQQDNNGPKQISIYKRPYKKIPQIFEPSRQKSIDPRFQQYAGSYNSDLAMKSFDFIPKIQQQQINDIKKTLQTSKAIKKNNRQKKRLTNQDKLVLQQQYNKLTNERRQHQLLLIQQQAKRNVRNSYSTRQQHSFVPRHKIRQEFQKVKQAKMTDQDRKEYLKNKEKKIFKNQQVDRNNLLFETGKRNKERRQGGGRQGGRDGFGRGRGRGRW